MRNTFTKMLASRFLVALSLWSSILLTAQTPRLVRDIYSGTGSSNPLGMTTYAGKVYFRADNGARGPGNNNELWVTDGSYYGTRMVKDINTQTTGNSSSNPGSFAVFNSKLYLSAKQAGATTPYDMWQSDGTDAGTQVHVVASSNPRNWLVNGSTMYFIEGGPSTSYIYKTNGTTVTQVTNFTQNNVGPFFNVGTKFIYGATTSTNNQLWICDGTLAGTTLLATLGTASWYPLPTAYCIFGGKVYFSAAGTSNDEELWVTDGTSTGTALFKNLNPSGASVPRNLIVFNNKLYFTATTSTNGVELWTSDGTTTGTVMVTDLNTGTASSSPDNLVVFGGKLYFTATTAATGTEIFVCTTTNTVTNLKDIASGATGSSPDQLTIFNGSLYFSANDGTNGTELWTSNGTAVGTTMVSNINAGAASSSPSGLMVSGSSLFFSANNGTKGAELHVLNFSAPPTLSLSATSTNLTCGASTTITSTGTSTAWNWSNGATTSSITVTPVHNTTYYVEGLSANGGVKLDSIKIVVTPAGGVTLSSSAGAHVCYGTPTTLSAAGLPTGSTYNWGYQFLSANYPYGVTTETTTQNPSGITLYYLESAKPNGCIDTTYITVQGHYAPTINISPGASISVCAGTSVTLTGNGAGTTNYTWSTGATGTNLTFTATTTTTVTVTGVDTWGCSATSAPKTVTVNAVPTITTADGSRCGTGDVTLGATSSVGTLAWYFTPTSTTVLGTGTSFNTGQLTGTSTFYVKGTNGTCTTNRIPVLATVNPLPSNAVTRSGNTLTATEAGATYQWFTCPATNINGAVAQAYTVITSGDYGVTITKNGCAATSSCQTISVTTALESSQMDDAIQLAPNPVHQVLSIDLRNINFAGSLLSVYSLQGQKMFSENVHNEMKLDVSAWPQGVYLIEVISENKIFRKQLLKAE